MASIKAILRRISSPLLQVGDLAFDAEVNVQRGGRAQFTQNRIGAGVDISDHSFTLPREYQVEGAVSGLAQPQNFGRPGAPLLGGLIDLGLGALEGLTGLNFATRVQDFEARLDAALEARDELELVSKVVGRRRVVMTDWQATTSPEDGDSSHYRITMREVQRAGLTIADATQGGLASAGSGGAIQPGGGGGSTTTPGALEVVP